jgi:hypothetical protein
MAIAAWVKPNRVEKDTRTLIESSAHGWWYTARLPDESRIIVYHTDAAQVRQILSHEVGWRECVNETVHIKEIAKYATLIGNLKCVEACGARLDVLAGDHWLAVGDSAMSFDPLSSQGMFNALYSGMKAAESIHEALSGNPQAVDMYVEVLERIRKST